MLALDAELSFNGGRYRLGDPIEVSEGYTVFEAQNLDLDRVEALKLFHDLDELDPDAVCSDAKRLAKLAHPAAPRVLGLGVTQAGKERRPAIAYERVTGSSLATLLAAGGALSPLRLFRVALSALEVCAEAHALGLGLGPLSLKQILIEQRQGQDHLRLASYAIGRLGAPLGRDRVGPLLASTPNAVAPEHYLGGPLEVRADLYSIAAWMYQAMAGEPPFEGDAPQLMRAHRRGAEAAPFPPWSRVPADLAAVVLCALEVSPSARFQSAEAMLAAMHAVDLEALLRTGTDSERARFGAPRRAAARPPEPSAPTAERGPPEVWVFVDGPELRQRSITGALATLEEELRIVRMDAAARAALLDPLSVGEQTLPWAVLFGDMHVLLDDALLLELTLHSGVARVLVSSHLNTELLHATIASVGLDAHLLASEDEAQLVVSCRAAVDRARSMRARALRPRPTPKASATPRPSLTLPSAQELGLDSAHPPPFRLGVLT